MNLTKIRTRIAPSPTGSPHIGTAYAALFNYCFAKKNKGDFVLRIEDTDRTRFVENSEKEINDALAWLGLEPDESPERGGKFGPYRQSERLEKYKKYTEDLVNSNSAYYCDCTAERLAQLREKQQKIGKLPQYDRKCRTEGPKSKENAVIRLAVPLEGETIVEDLVRGSIKFQNHLIDDQILMKSDGFPTYHLASVVDDFLMEITTVIRAEEWLSSTPKHVLLFTA
jgi:glutamyl-tRNA synthetase